MITVVASAMQLRNKGSRDKMMILSKYLLPSLLVVACFGCATNKSVEQLIKVQQATTAQIHRQAEEIRIQKERIQLLEEDKQELADTLAVLHDEVSQVQLKNQPSTHPNDTPLAKKNGAKQTLKPTKSSKPPFGKVVLGQIEWAWFDLLHRSVKTRIDTGLKSSLIYASKIQYFERDGDNWVRFYLQMEGEVGANEPEQAFEAPIVRRVKLRTGSGDETEKRAIVSLRVKVGDLVDDSEFIVNEKGSSAYPIVLGRSFLRDIAVVDVAKRFTQEKHQETSTL